MLSHDNGHDTGLRDGDYRVTADLWWGQNATVVKLFEDGALVGARAVEAASPGAQRATFDIAGRVNGTYTYELVALNPFGESRSAPLTVTVRDAAPGQAVLSATGVRTGDVTIAADLWWGTNATEYVLFRDGVEIDRQTLEARTPAAQHARTAIGALPAGTHVFTAELRNAAGTTATKPLTVTVRD